MFKKLRLDPDATEGGAQDDANKFDAASFKADILNSNKVMLENALSSMKTIVDTSMSTIKNVIPQQQVTQNNNVDSDLKEEIAALGLDAEGATAITKLVQKILSKNSSDQEEKIISRVDQNLDIKDKKALYEQKIKTKFPDFYNQSSPLFAQARQEFNSMSEEERQSPAAAWNAVTRAALELGVQPATIHQTPTFVEGGKPQKDPNKVTKEENDFASFFGADPKKYGDAKKQVSFN